MVSSRVWPSGPRRECRQALPRRPPDGREAEGAPALREQVAPPSWGRWARRRRADGVGHVVAATAPIGGLGAASAVAAVELLGQQPAAGAWTAWTTAAPPAGRPRPGGCRGAVTSRTALAQVRRRGSRLERRGDALAAVPTIEKKVAATCSGTPSSQSRRAAGARGAGRRDGSRGRSRLRRRPVAGRGRCSRAGQAAEADPEAATSARPLQNALSNPSRSATHHHRVDLQAGPGHPAW